MARFIASPAPTASRTVANPRRSMPDRTGTDFSVTSTLGMWACCERFSGVAITCTCRSISPGISVRPRTSITCAPGQLSGRSETCSIRPSTTSTSRAPDNSRATGSSNAPRANAMDCNAMAKALVWCLCSGERRVSARPGRPGETQQSCVDLHAAALRPRANVACTSPTVHTEDEPAVVERSRVKRDDRIHGAQTPRAPAACPGLARRRGSGRAPRARPGDAKAAGVDAAGGDSHPVLNLRATRSWAQSEPRGCQDRQGTSGYAFGRPKKVDRGSTCGRCRHVPIDVCTAVRGHSGSDADRLFAQVADGACQGCSPVRQNRLEQDRAFCTAFTRTVGCPPSMFVHRSNGVDQG